MKHFRKVIFFIILLILFGIQTGFADETKTFVAYSMKVAQSRVEEALKKGEDFRKKQSDLYYLGGITKPWAVVIDFGNNDWILLGERDSKSSVLTLDDWVVALKARFIHPEQDPGVTIDPRPCEECIKTGKREGCSHFTKQDVRFFADIENTHFGEVCFESDWLMKRIGFGLEKLPIKTLKSKYELLVEEYKNSALLKSRICSRFWFYPIVNRVNIFKNLVLLEKFQMGVFTEILYAEIDGKPVADIDNFEYGPSEQFSRSFSDNYDAIAEEREVIETLRGLTRLASLAKGLTQIDYKPKVDFYLSEYPLIKSETCKEIDKLTAGNQDVGFEMSGGVELMALTMRMVGGEAGALKELVLKARPATQALIWGFKIMIHDGHVAGVVLSKELTNLSQFAGLFLQANFLVKKTRYEDAIKLYTDVIKLKPNWIYPYIRRAVTYIKNGEYDKAILDCRNALRLDTCSIYAYLTIGDAYFYKGWWKQALNEYGKVLNLDSHCTTAYGTRGEINYRMKNYREAIKNYDVALRINPENVDWYIDRGDCYLQLRAYDKALKDAENALSRDDKNARAHLHKGNVYALKGFLADAEDEWKQAFYLDPSGLVGESAQENLNKNE